MYVAKVAASFFRRGYVVIYPRKNAITLYSFINANKVVSAMLKDRKYVFVGWINVDPAQPCCKLHASVEQSHHQTLAGAWFDPINPTSVCSSFLRVRSSLLFLSRLAVRCASWPSRRNRGLTALPGPSNPAQPGPRVHLSTSPRPRRGPVWRYARFEVSGRSDQSLVDNYFRGPISTEIKFQRVRAGLARAEDPARGPQLV